ncbi:hypothetical protein EZS27_026967 [termite gut metagenome]|uniref:Uncharacterized protein n=1 Tax=termite gut metagenome TaxID=433724 RepID=A0A5J4QQ29_9ZZZZ
MNNGSSIKKRQPKSIRLGWESRGCCGQNRKQLSKVVGNGIKVEAGTFSKSNKNNNRLIP